MGATFLNGERDILVMIGGYFLIVLGRIGVSIPSYKYVYIYIYMILTWINEFFKEYFRPELLLKSHISRIL